MPGAIVVDPHLLQQARQLYEETSVPVDAIAGMLGMKPRTFQARRAALGWRLRRGAAAQPGPESVVESDAETANAEPLVAQDNPEPRFDRVATIARVRDAVEREIAGVELSLRRLNRLSSRMGDAEKTARTLASLVKTLNELNRLDAGGAAPAAEADDEIDVDEYRRDLARRLAALCAGGEDG